MKWVVLAAAVLAWQPYCYRLLRIAQREHYIAGSVSRFALRWWTSTVLNRGLVAVAVVAAVLTWFSPAVGLVAAAVVAVGPLGLSLRGRTSQIGWTRRMRTFVAVAVALDAVVVLAGVAVGAAAPAAVALALLHPLVLDAALALTAPIERRLGQKFVDQAIRKLRGINPVTVAITGSYGKTTTKGYVRHLVSASRRVVASPASFNNMAGLSRAVNEHLAHGTEVFVAEMGTYGPGEIRTMCGWVKPRVGAITAIGPVHLERMGSIENIVRAKEEILDNVDVAVLNVDAPGLADVADRFAGRGTVIRCSALDPDADVYASESAGGLVVVVRGDEVARVDDGGGARPTNVACAVGAALALDLPLDLVARQLRSLPVPEHRQQVVTAPSGVVVIDDTFNSNPDGAAAALALLERHGAGGRRVVVTPGMVELGKDQDRENEAFARRAAEVATDVVIVQRTNRAALRRGAEGGPASVMLVDTREDAVAWVREHLGPGDAVLYENDLPDHFP
ncbi:MAG: Mur ligase family protein [Actinomycetota bacterium]